MPRKSPNYNREFLKNFVLSEAAKGTNMSGRHWLRTPGLTGKVQHIGKRKYFGYSTWNEYLEKEIGMSRLKKTGKYLTPFHQTPESAKSFVLARAKEGIKSSDKWGHTPGLNRVYDYLLRNGFFGKKSWRNYLESIGAKPVETRKHSRESLKNFVITKAQQGISANSGYWRKTKGLSVPYRALLREKFFGHKNWQKYLEKEIGITGLKKIGHYLLPFHPTRKSVKSFVKARIKDGAKMGPGHWQRTKGLGAVYGFVVRKKYFGHGNWRNYLEKECGYKKI